MQTFWQWLSRLDQSLIPETYYGIDQAEYNRLFDEELEKTIKRTSDPAHLQALERLKGFNWLAYIAESVRRSGFRDQRDIQERSHDIAVGLLTGKLFTGFDERRSGPFDLRFKASVGNAVRNQVEKEQNRRRLLPTVPIAPGSEPGRTPRADEDDDKVIEDFRHLVRRRLGRIGAAVLDARLAGEETKSLVGRFDLGFPDKNVVKKVVCQIKGLAREYALRLGDPDFLRDIERAMGREEATVAKRRAAMAARRAAVGA